jgi:hypothetical protein
MSRHKTPKPGTCRLRFHTLREDGLHIPIAFFFVTERMCAEILEEREAILSRTPAALLGKQAALLERYDPGVSANAFKDILNLCHVGASFSTADDRAGR